MHPACRHDHGGVEPILGAMLKATRLLLMFLLLGVLVPGLGAGLQGETPASPPQVPPAGPLTSKNIAVITIQGPIDAITLSSVQRRLKEAELAGADAVVFDIDTPGGELGAALGICTAIKKTQIKRTIAWVNPNAYSAGAIISLACQEILVSDAAAFGDAAPLAFNPASGIKSLSADERSKIVAPIVAELVDSARRSGWDEKLVQGFVSRGAELWLVKHKTTGQQLFVDRYEYQMIFGEEPAQGRPAVASSPDAEPAPKVPQGAATPGSTDLRPAVPLNPADVSQANLQLSLKPVPSTRPVITPADAGQWTLLEYVSDGKSIITLRQDQMLRYKMASGKVNTDEELKAYCAGVQIGRQHETWYELAARFMSGMIVRSVLVVLIILGIFIELIHPGLIAPGAVAGLAMIGLLLPALLTGLAGWWEVLAIGVGIVLLLVEVFILPGFGVAGALGLLLLFGGLVMTFIPSASGLPFADPGARWRGLQYGLVSVTIGIATTGVVLYYISKHAKSLPIFGRLILQERGADDQPILATAGTGPLPASIGDTGTALTPLRPSGKMDLDGRVLDVVSDAGVIDAGTRIRVLAVDAFRIVVERA